ncbi:MAG: protein kinase [Roseburia sp.]|nr:protein kinase [Roseburia sp.]
MSYYQTIATLNETHKIYLVQHQETKKIYVKKVLDVYNKAIYQYLLQNHIIGTPQIINLYEEDNQLIVIENYIPGYTLQELIDSSSISINSIYQYMIELCAILEKLHSLQPPIIHRDIKPSNIIITEYNHVILLDFNAAKYFTESTNNDTVLLGTQGYAAPEQYGFGSSSPRTDIYALGILLKELSSALPEKSEPLNRIITSCIQIDPNNRYQSVSDLKKALESAWFPKKPEPRHTLSIKAFLPPGYRTLTPWKMFISSVTYIFIFWLCLSLQVENTFGLALWIERIFCLFMMLSIIFIGFNYLDIQKFFPLCKHRFKAVHHIGIVLFDVIMIFTLFFIMFLIESIFFL